MTPLPPGPFEVRTDAGARKLVERMDAVRKDVDELKADVHGVGVDVARLEGHIAQAVTWPKLVAILGATAATVIGVAWLIVSASDSRSTSSVAAVQARLADDIRQIRAETTTRLDRFEAKQDAILRVTIDGKPRQVAKKELERRTGETRTDSN